MNNGKAILVPIICLFMFSATLFPIFVINPNYEIQENTYDHEQTYETDYSQFLHPKIEKKQDQLIDPTPSKLPTIDFETIDYNRYWGNLSNEIESYFVIQKESEWITLWNSTYHWRWKYVNNTSIPVYKPPPLIDFNNYTVIAAFYGAVESGGYAIRITEILSDVSGIFVHVIKYPPGCHANRTWAVTYPYHIVKIDKTFEPISFQVEIFEYRVI